ncbi:hypothetical protein DIPPA_24264 [Diplonema papillatum]|nr:hypothetical protein DIPPA_24264 [Diplonema papillatum]
MEAKDLRVALVTPGRLTDESRERIVRFDNGTEASCYVTQWGGADVGRVPVAKEVEVREATTVMWCTVMYKDVDEKTRTSLKSAATGAGAADVLCRRAAAAAGVTIERRHRFNHRCTSTRHTVSVRVTTREAPTLLRSSGKGGVYWAAPSFVNGNELHPVVWLAEDAKLEQAMEIAGHADALGVAAARTRNGVRYSASNPSARRTLIDRAGSLAAPERQGPPEARFLVESEVGEHQEEMLAALRAVAVELSGHEVLRDTHIAIPSTGGSTIECTFSNRHGNFAHRGSKQLDNIKYVRVRNLAEAEALRYQLGKQNLKDVSPAATIVTTMVATKPTRRFLRSFAKTVGTPNAPNSDMRCDGKMAQRMKDKKFSIEAYAKVPVEGRRLCEWANNPMVKALTNLNANDKATEEHLEDAKRNLNKLDVLMIEGQESRSMLLLMSKLNLSEGSYIPCAPYDDPATAVSSLRVTYVIAQDNDPDRLLNAEISHIFHTKYAGTIEQTKDSKRVECSPQPIVCFDENDQNEERKAKDLYVNVQATLQRSSSRASVMCAGECRLPKD